MNRRGMKATAFLWYVNGGATKVPVGKLNNYLRSKKFPAKEYNGKKNELVQIFQARFGADAYAADGASLLLVMKLGSK